MKILIAEKLDKVRSALRLLIEQEPDCQVVGEASCASSLYQGLCSLEPELLVLEWDLPGLEGAERIEIVRRFNPDLKVIAITKQDSGGVILGADSTISVGDLPQRVLAVLRSFSSPQEPVEGENRTGRDLP